MTDERAEQPMSEPWLLANETSVIEAYRHGFDEGRASTATPMTTWRGLCGHVWDRAIENTDECPRCSERAARGRVEAALHDLTSLAGRLREGDSYWTATGIDTAVAALRAALTEGTSKSEERG